MESEKPSFVSMISRVGVWRTIDGDTHYASGSESGAQKDARLEAEARSDYGCGRLETLSGSGCDCWVELCCNVSLLGESTACEGEKMKLGGDALALLRFDSLLK